MKNKCSGFTLIEVLITVAILGIIAAVAIPSYSSYMTKTRRTEAKSLLTEIASEQQRYYSENNTYAEKLSEIGYPSDAVESENGNYSVAVSAFTRNTFTLTATRVAGKAQANDTACGDFRINSAGAKSVTTTTPVGECW